MEKAKFSDQILYDHFDISFSHPTCLNIYRTKHKFSYIYWFKTQNLFYIMENSINRKKSQLFNIHFAIWQMCWFFYFSEIYLNSLEVSATPNIHFICTTMGDKHRKTKISCCSLKFGICTDIFLSCFWNSPALFVMIYQYSRLKTIHKGVEQH